ncbi:bacteriocin immunity protein [Streptomyces sp. NPDC046994]|uniref:bacteriocin immunity protein n=1 Tax=Streptomyces sp. NPDC046994 TaxID=3155735 RepID=UPI003456AEE5
MDLRAELTPPQVSRQRLDELCSEILHIADLVLCGSGSADEGITAFNARTGHSYVALDFAEYDGSRNLVEFALEAARPARPRIADITTDELVEIVRRLLASDPESDYYLRLLEANVSHPRVSDLIFHPPAELLDASAEQIVDEALKYRLITL